MTHNINEPLSQLEWNGLIGTATHLNLVLLISSVLLPLLICTVHMSTAFSFSKSTLVIIQPVYDAPVSNSHHIFHFANSIVFFIAV